MHHYGHSMSQVSIIPEGQVIHKSAARFKEEKMKVVDAGMYAFLLYFRIGSLFC